MMKTQVWIKWLLVVTVVAVLAGSYFQAQAAEADNPQAPPAVEPANAQETDYDLLITGDLEDTICKIKQPCDWMKICGDIRLREIFAPNMLLNQEDRHFQRYRFRLGTTVTPIKDLDLNFRMVWEPRHFCQPSSIDDWTMSEVIIDTANIKLSNVLDLPLTLTVGRQDIIFGDGWLVLDGTPLDGSRTIFFDAARATVDLKDVNTKVDLVYIHQHADSDWWAEPVCDKDFHNMNSL